MSGCAPHYSLMDISSFSRPWLQQGSAALHTLALRITSSTKLFVGQQGSRCMGQQAGPPSHVERVSVCACVLGGGEGGITAAGFRLGAVWRREARGEGEGHVT